MSYTKLTSVVYVKDQAAYTDSALKKPVSKDLSAVEVCMKLYHNGADAIIYYDLSYDDASHEKAIGDLRIICKSVDIPVYATGNIKRVEDVKKYLI